MRGRTGSEAQPGTADASKKFHEAALPFLRLQHVTSYEASGVSSFVQVSWCHRGADRALSCCCKDLQRGGSRPAMFRSTFGTVHT